MSSQPLTDWYDAASNMPETFRTRPVVGGHLALLALNSSSIADTGSTNSSPSSSNSNTGYATTIISVVYPLMGGASIGVSLIWIGCLVYVYIVIQYYLFDVKDDVHNRSLEALKYKIGLMDDVRTYVIVTRL
ncbi:hypothetical protein F5051DRAFT_448747 [Lentinula edodes]|nr:hypothetical protein F5051DRAFT_448747 [Lentinula edodes]